MGIRPGRTNRQVYMTDIVPTLAALLRVQMPNGCVGKPIEAVFARHRGRVFRRKSRNYGHFCGNLQLAEAGTGLRRRGRASEGGVGRQKAGRVSIFGIRKGWGQLVWVTFCLISINKK